jgi:hypothetical protein
MVVAEMCSRTTNKASCIFVYKLFCAGGLPDNQFGVLFDNHIVKIKVKDPQGEL